jgi:hypothetical protein
VEYGGSIGFPLYLRGEGGAISDDIGELSGLPADPEVSFFREYHYKLEKLCDVFCTDRGKAPVLARRKAAADFYESLPTEVREADEAVRERQRRLTEA